MLFCDNCGIKYIKIEGQIPKESGIIPTSDMLIYGEGNDYIYEFCSKKCMDEQELKYPNGEDTSKWVKKISKYESQD